MGLSVIWVIDWLVSLKQLSIGCLLAFVFMHPLKKKQLKVAYMQVEYQLKSCSWSLTSLCSLLFSDSVSDEVIGTHFIDLSRISNDGANGMNELLVAILFYVSCCVVLIYICVCVTGQRHQKSFFLYLTQWYLCNIWNILWFKTWVDFNLSNFTSK